VFEKSEVDRGKKRSGEKDTSSRVKVQYWKRCIKEGKGDFKRNSGGKRVRGKLLVWIRVFNVGKEENWGGGEDQGQDEKVERELGLPKRKEA